tara:strand:+ start:27 stop:158 length:132 start_codon:yes stop_codon:yes gene_type:complete
MLTNSTGSVLINNGGFKSLGPPPGDITDAHDVNNTKNKRKYIL